MDKTKKETLENLMRQDGENVTAAEDKADAIDLEEPKKRTWLVVLLSILATLLVAGGAYVAYQSFSAGEKLSAEEKIETPATQNAEQPAETPTTTSAQTVYITASEGLNMRKEANATSEVLKIIPFGTKLTIMETSGDWYKVEYDSATGWVAKLFTATSDPLIYKNTDYSFTMVFPTTWNTYAVVKRANVDAGATAYYDVTLTTTDTTNYASGSVSMFVISVYTPSQWAAFGSNGEPKPNLVKEGTNYVFAYSMAQAAPEDVTARRSDISAIVKTLTLQ